MDCSIPLLCHWALTPVRGISKGSRPGETASYRSHWPQRQHVLVTAVTVSLGRFHDWLRRLTSSACRFMTRMTRMTSS